MGVKRFGVAFVATASIVLAYALPARAQEAPPPASSSPAETTSTEATTPGARRASADTVVLRAGEAGCAGAGRHTVHRHGEDRQLLRREHSGTGREERRARDDRARRAEPAGGQAGRGDARTEGRRQARAGRPQPPAAPRRLPQRLRRKPPRAPAPSQLHSTQVTIVLVAETPAAADPAASATGTPPRPPRRRPR